MNILVRETYEKMSEAAATIFVSQVISKPDSIIGLATGSTPLGTYAGIIQRYQEGIVDFKAVRSFNLDEYKGIDKSNDQSYDYFMWENLFSKINICKDNVKIPNGKADNIQQECDAYDEMIDRAGGIDIQLLGIGVNGHIGFNEPADVFEPKTHVVELDKKTIQSNARFFSSIEEVPKFAVTMGIGTIMKAKKIVLIATGENKAEIMREVIYGKVTPQVPASILQFHNNVTIILDAEAASKLK